MALLHFRSREIRRLYMKPSVILRVYSAENKVLFRFYCRYSLSCYIEMEKRLVALSDDSLIAANMSKKTKYKSYF